MPKQIETCISVAHLKAYANFQAEKMLNTGVFLSSLFLTWQPLEEGYSVQLANCPCPFDGMGPKELLVGDPFLVSKGQLSSNLADKVLQAGYVNRVGLRDP